MRTKNNLKTLRFFKQIRLPCSVSPLVQIIHPFWTQESTLQANNH